MLKGFLVLLLNHDLLVWVDVVVHINHHHYHQYLILVIQVHIDKDQVGWVDLEVDGITSSQIKGQCIQNPPSIYLVHLLNWLRHSMNHIHCHQILQCCELAFLIILVSFISRDMIGKRGALTLYPSKNCGNDNTGSKLSCLLSLCEQ